MGLSFKNPPGDPAYNHSSMVHNSEPMQNYLLKKILALLAMCSSLPISNLQLVSNHDLPIAQ